MRSVQVALVSFVLAADVLASGNWLVQQESDWYMGAGRNLDFITQSGILRVRRNISDEFNYTGGDYDALPSYWTCQPDYCSYQRVSTANHLRLVATLIPSEWIGNTDRCPKIYQPIDGDFEVETSAKSGAGIHDYWNAQLFVKAAPYTWFAVGSNMTSGGYRHLVRLTTEGSSILDLGSVAASGPSQYRIKKVGNLLTGSYRVGTTYFIDLASTTIDSAVWRHLSVGVYMKDTSIQGSWAAFDYMYFSTTRTSSDSCYYLSRVFDLGATPTAAGTISWAESVPAGAAVMVHARSSGNGVAWGPWTGPYSTPGGSAVTASLARYFQFSVTLFENPSLESPAIDYVILSFPGEPPSSPIVGSTSHPGESWRPESEISLTLTMPGSNPAPVWAYYYAMSVSPVSGTSPSVSAVIVTSTATGVSVSGFSDGEHKLFVVAMGEPNEYPLSPASEFLVRRDSIPPGPVTITSPTHVAATSSQNNSPVFEMSSVDSTSVTLMVSGIAGFHYVLDDQAGTIPDASSAFTTENVVAFSGLKNQTWWFHARALDAAGNLGGPGHFPVSIDFSGVLLTELAVHAVPHPIRTSVARIRYELAAPADSVTAEIRDDAGHRVARITGTTGVGRNELAWNNTGLANGVYYLRIIARRADGKEDKVTKKLALLR